MKYVFLAAIIAVGCLAMAACGTTSGGVPSPAGVHLAVSKADYGAQVAYGVVLKAVADGVVTGAKARALTTQADDLMTKVGKAIDVGDSASVQTLTASLAALAAPYKPAPVAPVPPH